MLIRVLFTLLCVTAFANVGEAQANQTYRLEIVFAGTDIQLHTKDGAEWVLPIIFTANGGNAKKCGVSINSPAEILFNSEDFKTKVSCTVSVTVKTPLDTLTIETNSDGVVAVQGVPGSFVDTTPGRATHKIKLK